MGRLTRDPEIRYSQNNNQMAVARFSLAVDRRIKRDNQPTADFFNCTAFGKTAEFVERYIKKGTKVVLDGEIQNDNYQGKDGNMVYGTRIVVNSLEFAESKNAAGAGIQTYDNVDAQPAPAEPANEGGYINIPDGIDEELPFV